MSLDPAVKIYIPEGSEAVDYFNDLARQILMKKSGKPDWLPRFFWPDPGFEELIELSVDMHIKHARTIRLYGAPYLTLYQSELARLTALR